MSERRAYNEMKSAILEILKQKGGLTSKDIAKSLGCDVHHVGMSLLRLYRQGLVRRDPGFVREWKKPPYLYRISDRGRARLQYYREAPGRGERHE